MGEVVYSIGVYSKFKKFEVANSKKHFYYFPYRCSTFREVIAIHRLMKRYNSKTVEI